MAYPSRSPPKAAGVKPHTRSGARRKRKATPAATYWECYRGAAGCGVHHKGYSSAVRHSRQLDRVERRKFRAKGERLALWHPEKRGAGAK